MSSRTFLFFLIAMAPAVTAQGVEQVDTSSLLVTSGTGVVTLPPDRATITFSISTRDVSAAAAARNNNSTVRRVLDSLNAVKQVGESIQVTGVSVGSQEESETGKITGYEAATDVRVSTRVLDRVATIIDVALRVGANRLDNIEFHSDRVNEADREALGRAYSEARANATALAKAAGLELGALVRLSTEPEPYRSFGSNVFEEAGVVVSRGQVPVTPREIRVSRSVTVTWRLKSSKH